MRVDISVYKLVFCLPYLILINNIPLTSHSTIRGIYNKNVLLIFLVKIRFLYFLGTKKISWPLHSVPEFISIGQNLKSLKRIKISISIVHKFPIKMVWIAYTFDLWLQKHILRQ